jgi:hypothetical protein
MRRSLLVFALALPLLTAHPAGGLDTLWTLLSSLWSESTSDAGCEMDPSGSCKPLPQPQTDAGCEWDPSGAGNPLPQPQTDEGCGMDPSGCPKGS